MKRASQQTEARAAGRGVRASTESTSFEDKLGTLNAPVVRARSAALIGGLAMFGIGNVSSSWLGIELGGDVSKPMTLRVQRPMSERFTSTDDRLNGHHAIACFSFGSDFGSVLAPRRSAQWRNAEAS